MRTVSQTFLTLSAVANIRTLKSIAVVFFVGAWSPAHAADVTFRGQLDVVLEDSGGGVYSDVPIGSEFFGNN